MIWESQTEGFPLLSLTYRQEYAQTHHTHTAHIHTHTSLSSTSFFSLLFSHSQWETQHCFINNVILMLMCHINNKEMLWKWQLEKRKSGQASLNSFSKLEQKKRKIADYGFSPKLEVCSSTADNQKNVYSCPLQTSFYVQCMLEEILFCLLSQIVAFCLQIVLLLSTKDSRIIFQKERKKYEMGGKKTLLYTKV